MTESERKTPRSIDARLEEYVEEYTFEGDSGSYTPTEAERMMLLDFAHGLVEQERERAAKLLEPSMSEIQLAAGEMSAQEKMAVRAVLDWLARRIREAKP